MDSHMVMLLLVLATTIGAFSPALFSGFELNDEHLNMRLASGGQIHSQVPVRPSLWAMTKADVLGLGRVAPVGEALRYLTSVLIGPRPALLRGVILGYAIGTALLLYWAASRVFGSHLVGGLFAVWIMQSPEPGPAEVWIHLVRGEHLGMLLLAASVFCTVCAASHPRVGLLDWAAFACFVASSLCKETFILVGPALLYMRWYLAPRPNGESRRHMPAGLLPVLLAYGLWVVLVLSLCFFVACTRVGSHGARSLQATAGTVLTAFLGPGGMVRGVGRQSVWFIPVIGFAIWQLLSRQKGYGYRYPLTHLLVFMFLWVAPQVAIYATRGQMEGRYWLPMLVGLCVPSALALRALTQENADRWVQIAVGALMLFWLSRCLQINFASSVNFSNRTHAIARLARSVAASVPPSGTVVIVAPPKTEHAYSLLCHFGFQGRPDVKGYLFQPQGSDGYVSVFRGFDDPCQLRPDDVDGVVFLLPPGKAKLADQPWYDPSRFRRSSVLEPQFFLSLRRLRWMTYQYGFEIDIPHGSGS